MNELNQKQLKTRWIEIKKQISARQLLAYRVGIPIEKWDEYMLEIPNDQEINRIYLAIQEDRKVKTARIKESLSKIVGYREALEVSKIAGVSDTSVRSILDGKKEMAGYDIINKLELFLSIVLPEFEVSIENPLSFKSYSNDHFQELTFEINKVTENLKQYCFELLRVAKTQQSELDWRGEKIKPTYGIEISIKKLAEIKDKIELFWKHYVDKES